MVEYDVPKDIIVSCLIGKDNLQPAMCRIQKICYDTLGVSDTSKFVLFLVDGETNKWAIIPIEKQSLVKIKKRELDNGCLS